MVTLAAEVHIGTELDSALWETSAATVTGINLTASDIITFTVGNATVTTSVTTNQGSAFGKVQAVTDAVQAAYVAKVQLQHLKYFISLIIVMQKLLHLFQMLKDRC